jgi:hypothetical protein
VCFSVFPAGGPAQGASSGEIRSASR